MKLYSLLVLVEDQVYRTFDLFFFERVNFCCIYLGQQIAVLFAKRGAIVVLCDSNEIGNSQTIELISAINTEQRVYSYICDIGNRDEVEQLVKRIQADVGDITILVNNGLQIILFLLKFYK